MEELKVIMEGISGLGDEAKTAFVVWVLTKYGLHYFTVGGIFTGLFYVILKIANVIISHINFTEQIKATMGFHRDLTQREKNYVLDLLRKGTQNETN